MKKKEMACFLLIILLIAILITVICIIPRNNASSPKKTVENFIEAFEQKDVDAMMENIAPYEVELIKSVIARLEKNDQIQTYKKLVKYLLKSPQISDFVDRLITISFDNNIVFEKSDGDFATVIVRILGDDEIKFWKFHLVKIDNQWYIEYITVLKKQEKSDL